MAPALARAQTAAPGNGRVHFSDVARLKSLSLLRTPALTRCSPNVAKNLPTLVVAAHPDGVGEEASSRREEQAKREELHKLEMCLQRELFQERLAQKRSHQDMDLRDFHRARAEVAEKSIAKLISKLPAEDRTRHAHETLGKVNTSGPTRNVGRWARGFPAIKGSEQMGIDDTGALATSSSAPGELPSLVPPSTAPPRVRTEEAYEAIGKGAIDEWMMRKNAATVSSEASTCSPNTTRQSFFSNRQHNSRTRSFSSGAWQRPSEEDRRQVIRSELIEAVGSPIKAFRIMDLSGSGRVSFQEFSDGLERLDIQCEELTSLKKLREVFKLFDLDKDGTISLEELFPETVLSEMESNRISTPDMWSRWCKGTKDCIEAREPCWQENPDEELQLLFDTVQAREAVSEKRKWMSSTMRRLKNQGKSDARCREVLALHLPRGTGPKDRDDVPTFSDFEVKNCRKDYCEQVSLPVRNIQKTVYDMREQRKVLQEARHRLRTVTRGHAHSRGSVTAPTGLSSGFFKLGTSSKILSDVDEEEDDLTGVSTGRSSLSTRRSSMGVGR